MIMMTGRLYIWLFSHVSLKGENRNRSTRRQVTHLSGEESQERIHHVCGVGYGTRTRRCLPERDFPFIMSSVNLLIFVLRLTMMARLKPSYR